MTIVGICLIALASVASTHDEISGLKYPNELSEGTEPVLSFASIPKHGQKLSGYTELIPYLLPSPDQEGGGSCLYMSLTGTLEWWLAKNAGEKNPKSDGAFDVSERYLMNANSSFSSNRVKNWRTDKVYKLQKLNGVALNKDYRYTKGYYIKDGGYRKALPTDPKARYGTRFNWVNELRDYRGPLTKIPKLGRQVLASPKGAGQWSVGVMPKDIVSKTKAALKDNQAPILAMYNHFGYWHVSMIVGFSDTELSDDCRFTRAFPKHMLEKAQKAKDKALVSVDQTRKDKLLWKAGNWTRQANSVQKHLDEVGCSKKGMFYIRDSIYSLKGQPIYDYDKSQVGEETPYSAKIVMRDYTWLEAMANHVIQIVPEP